MAEKLADLEENSLPLLLKLSCTYLLDALENK